ncbi:MAG TPA: DUF2202 domain-containing protein [Methanoregulaceae archaeon]|nr:DUF2202 domain-containing protein [Methanoregulaceae archaeon]
MIRKVSTFMILLIVLSTLSIPVIAAGGNGGSDGADGAGSGGSGGNDNAGSDSAGNAGTGAGSSTGQAGPQAQTIQEEQERNQQETVDQPGIQINQQDRDLTQGRTGVDTTEGITSPDTIRQKDRDNFLQQISQLEQNLSRDQERDQAQVDLALSTFAIAGSVTGDAGPELTRLTGEIHQSLAAAYQAEQQINTRSSFMRMLIGGDRDAAGLLIQYADQNQQRIQAMEQLLANCSDCDPQVRVKLEEQVQTLSQEQNRLLTLGQQEQGDRGLFGWLFGGSSTVFAGAGQATPLTDDEKYWMTYMREEEKLARDVYLSLGSRWNIPIFANIAQSEQVHMDSVKTLLDRYGVPDPAAGKAQGEFTNPVLQNLYHDLIAQGSASPVEALNAGVLVEETDIADLNKALATTQKNDIRTVYNNLLQGSMNHLNAFQSNLASY